jgi:hypothetical protein
MSQDLAKKWERLKTFLDMVPIERDDSSFHLETVNAGKVECHGLLDNDHLKMDWVLLGSSVETRWTIQDRGINFLVNKGALELHFRLNERVHFKPLSIQQSLRIPAGIPFMLRTYEKKCSILLISAAEEV